MASCRDAHRACTGMNVACILHGWNGGSRGTHARLSGPARRNRRGDPGCEEPRVTTTDIGILLIVLCVLLWAIMAALHRHTVQLEALKAQMQELLKARQAGDSGHAAGSSRTSGPRDNIERLAPHAADNPSHRTERKSGS